LLRRSTPLLRIAARACSSSSGPLVSKSLTDDGILTLRFNNEKKLNAWTMPLMKQLFSEMGDAAKDDDVKGVIITGSGKYYSAGVDLSAMLRPMKPSTLVRKIRDENEQVFRHFLDFPKPIVAAVNGPAIGAAVTSQTLMDYIVAHESATFSLPFAKLGVPPEGCSSVLFAEKMGKVPAELMLGPDNWVPTAAEALDAGLIDEVVKPDPGVVFTDGIDMLDRRAIEVVRERIKAGGKRRFDQDELERLRTVNADESADLANAFVSYKFLNAMYDWNVMKNKPGLSKWFYLMKTMLPLWQPASIKPSYVD